MMFAQYSYLSFLSKNFFSLLLAGDCGYVWADVNLKVCTQYIAHTHTHARPNNVTNAHWVLYIMNIELILFLFGLSNIIICWLHI